MRVRGRLLRGGKHLLPCLFVVLLLFVGIGKKGWGLGVGVGGSVVGGGGVGGVMVRQFAT